MVSRANVERLVDAAWRGMSEELAVNNASAEDVINAAINMARNAVILSCKMGVTPEHKAHNRRAMRNALQQILLDTVDVEGAGPVQ